MKSKMTKPALLTSLALALAASACSTPGVDDEISRNPERAANASAVEPATPEPRTAELVRAYMSRAKPSFDHQDMDRQMPFFAKMNMVQMDFLPLSADDLVKESQLVVRGKIEAVVDGRTIDFQKGPSNPLLTSVFRVRVAKVLKGSETLVGKAVYVEVYRAPIVKTKDLQATRPTLDMMMFLKPAHWNHSALKYSGSGVPEGEVLYSLRTPQGVLVEQAAGKPVLQPLSPEPIMGGDPRTIDEVEAAVRQMAK